MRVPDAAGFDYAISDGSGGTDTGHVAVDVDCANDAPVAVDDTASGTEDMPVTIDPADLVADDTDVDLDTLSVTGVSNDGRPGHPRRGQHHLHAGRRPVRGRP